MSFRFPCSWSFSIAGIPKILTARTLTAIAFLLVSSSPAFSWTPPFPLPQLGKKTGEPKKATVEENGINEIYPWKFTGRMWVRPALVRVSPEVKTAPSPSSIFVLSLFGWTIGGVVALEYDESPVGPYREYVTMGAVVGSKRGAIGQWGSNFYVSKPIAEEVCREVWGVPARLANIDFVEESENSPLLHVSKAPSIDSSQQQTMEDIVVERWSNTRVHDVTSLSPQYGRLPVLWTPTIKALWAPIVLFSPSTKNDENKDDDKKEILLPLHKLRLSASALRLQFCGQSPSHDLGIPIGIGVTVDNLLIEIARQDGTL